jgi:hypothetical protein
LVGSLGSTLPPVGTGTSRLHPTIASDAANMSTRFIIIIITLPC